MTIYLGDDWSEQHHDVHLMNEAGERLDSKRLREGVAGVAALHELLASHAKDPGEVVVGIETDRGPWVEALRGAGYTVYAINPLAASRYRARHHVGGAKSDPADAKLLADLVRTDRHNHRPIAADSEQAKAVCFVARSQQQLVWDQTARVNRLRAELREVFPGALLAFPKLAHGDALGVLAMAAEPEAAAKLTLRQLCKALRDGGRQRGVEQRARKLREALREPQLAVSAELRRAGARGIRATVAQLVTLREQLKELEAGLAELFGEHPQAELYRSLPGLGVVLASRLLGEFGDDPERYESAKARMNYAGTSPLTVASGRKRTVRRRHAGNRRAVATATWWAQCSRRSSPGCEAYYQARRAAGDSHYQALRALGNRLVGLLHGCLRSGTPYDEARAWSHRREGAALAA